MHVSSHVTPSPLTGKDGQRRHAFIDTQMHKTQLPIFLSWVPKTQPNHWTKRVVSTRLTTNPRNCHGPEDRSWHSVEADPACGWNNTWTNVREKIIFFCVCTHFYFFVFQSRHALLTHICINTYANARADCQVVVHLHICRKRERGSERGRERVREREREWQKHLYVCRERERRKVRARLRVRVGVRVHQWAWQRDVPEHRWGRGGALARGEVFIHMWDIHRL